jgi:serine/threonine protein kinase
MTHDTISPYRILDKLGEGGMGRVFRAVDTRLGRTVAVKVVNAAFTRRFEREARAIAALTHPHICTLHDVGEHEGAPFLVMEFVEGKPLQSVPRKISSPHPPRTSRCFRISSCGCGLRHMKNPEASEQALSLGRLRSADLLLTGVDAVPKRRGGITVGPLDPAVLNSADAGRRRVG